MTLNSRDFRDAMGRFATGVCIVTCKDMDGRPWGATVNSFSSVSLDPPLVLFSLDRAANCFTQFSSCRSFAVNVLRVEQVDLSRAFASQTNDKWNGVGYETWDTGAPILAGSLASLECDAVASHDGGDHVIFIGRVRRLSHGASGEPLLYFQGKYRALESVPD
ncbi:MAG TPA: flavin reductase family protein [Candidatus Cybelea sp.]|nr:flavin reductase family protein [Candidatus Cybelea sp.]